MHSMNGESYKTYVWYEIDNILLKNDIKTNFDGWFENFILFYG